jgi:hypothetical protein
MTWFPVARFSRQRAACGSAGSNASSVTTPGQVTHAFPGRAIFNGAALASARPQAEDVQFLSYNTILRVEK